MYSAASSQGIFAAAGTPAGVVAKLNAESNRIMQLPELQSRLPKQGLNHIAMTPDEFSSFVRAEKDKWAPLVKASGARAD